MKDLKKTLSIILTTSIVVLSLTYCASVSVPTGGKKDTTPPKVTRSIPEQNSTNFNGNKIEISFDEFVTLDNASQNIIISPPLKNKPDTKLVGKTLVIKFNEDLKPDATYTLYLSSCIRDLHESNLLESHVLTFSTGDHLDSLSIAGTLFKASDMSPVDKAFVTLYDAELDNIDSLPTLATPSYVVRTGKDGKFCFKGLADKEYLVFALNDMNGNYYYDQPNEDVAFIDSLVRAVYEGKTSIDSLTKSDTLVNDSIGFINDSIKSVSVTNMNALDLKMYMFSKADTSQVVLESKLTESGIMRFVFRQSDSCLNVCPLASLPDSLHHATRKVATNDTIFWYFTPGIVDSVKMLISDGKSLTDTVALSLSAKGMKAPTGKVGISSNLIGSLLMPEDPFILVFSEPVMTIIDSDSLLLSIDTTSSTRPIFVPADSSLTRYIVCYDFVEGNNYSMTIPDSTFISIRGTHNDAKTLTFHRAKEEEYGSLFIKVVPPIGIPQVIIELIDSKGRIIDTQIIREERELEYWYLAEGKYKLKAILDADGNGRWSNGDYARRFLPETILEYGGSLDVKAGWDIDLSEPWDLSEP